jgi:hypothetical protein
VRVVRAVRVCARSDHYDYLGREDRPDDSLVDGKKEGGITHRLTHHRMPNARWPKASFTHDTQSAHTAHDTRHTRHTTHALCTKRRTSCAGGAGVGAPQGAKGHARPLHRLCSSRPATTEHRQLREGTACRARVRWRKRHITSIARSFYVLIECWDRICRSTQIAIERN